MSAPFTIAGAQSLLAQLHLSPGTPETNGNNPTLTPTTAIESEPGPKLSSKFTTPTLVSSLPDLWPSSSSSSSARPRLIVIGDVHGQLPELRALLAKAGYAAARGDRVVLAGDAVNKGADSAGVVALAMAEGFAAVRGNHEDRVLRVFALSEAVRTATAIAAARKTPGNGESAGKEEEGGKEEEVMAWEDVEARLPRSDRAALATARSLSLAQRAWLADLPVMLRLGAAPGSGKGEVVVVHAGLVPGLALEEQDPWAVMNMRTLLYPKKEKGKDKKKKNKRGTLRKEDQAVFESSVEKRLKDTFPAATVSEAAVAAETERLLEHYASSGSGSGSGGDGGGDEDASPPPVPVDTREGRSWAKVWNEIQKAKPAEPDRTTVVYGHDAKKGLNVKEYTFGLDSGCVKGGELTALVFEPDEKEEEGGGVVVRHRLVSVAYEPVGGDRGGEEEGNGGKEKKKKQKKEG